MLVAWSILGKVDIEMQAVGTLKMRVIWAKDSGILVLHHGLGRKGASSKAMFHWPHGALSYGKGYTEISVERKLVWRGIFLDGNTAWEFSKSWLLSLRTIDKMNPWAKCQRSCFASQAGLLGSIPFTFLESLPSKYPVLFCRSKPSIHWVHNVKKAFSKICYLS